MRKKLNSLVEVQHKLVKDIEILLIEDLEQKNYQIIDVASAVEGDVAELYFPRLDMTLILKHSQHLF